MASDRRQFLRVLFERSIEVHTADWRDPAATGLDISLNGCRFHCEHSMMDGETVNITFESGFELEGKVRWCWPIEWYYQAAVQFTEITGEERSRLREYIIRVTGEDYPEKAQEEESVSNEQEAAGSSDNSEEEDELLPLMEDEEQLEEFSLSIEEEELEEFNPLKEEDLEAFKSYDEEDQGGPESFEGEDQQESVSLEEQEALDPLTQTADEAVLEENKDDDPQEFREGELNPMQFQGKQLVILGGRKDQANLIKQYLEERTGITVEFVTKKQNLWRLMKLDVIDVVIMEWDLDDENNSLEILEQTQDQFPEVCFIAISAPLSLESRLKALNAGVRDIIARPVHMSGIAQIVLSCLSQPGQSDTGGIIQKSETIPIMGVSEELEPLTDEGANTTLDLLDGDLNRSPELDLIDEEF